MMSQMSNVKSLQKACTVSRLTQLPGAVLIVARLGQRGSRLPGSIGEWLSWTDIVLNESHEHINNRRQKCVVMCIPLTWSYL